MSLTSKVFLSDALNFILGLEPGMSLMLKLSLNNFLGVAGLFSKEGSLYSGFSGLLGLVARLL